MSEIDWRSIMHDLRNPLNSISINTDLAKLSLEQAQQASAIEALEVIALETRKLGERINQLEEKLKSP